VFEQQPLPFGQMQAFLIVILSMAISGHRNEQSLVHYNARPSSLQLRNCSDVLARLLITDGHTSSTPSGSSQAQSSTQQHISVASTSTLLVQRKAHTCRSNFAVAGSMFSSCSICSVQIVYKSNSD
jgi:hypothetical protein